MDRIGASFSPFLLFVQSVSFCRRERPRSARSQSIVKAGRRPPAAIVKNKGGMKEYLDFLLLLLPAAIEDWQNRCRKKNAVVQREREGDIEDEEREKEIETGLWYSETRSMPIHNWDGGRKRPMGVNPSYRVSMLRKEPAHYPDAFWITKLLLPFPFVTNFSPTVFFFNSQNFSPLPDVNTWTGASRRRISFLFQPKLPRSSVVFFFWQYATWWPPRKSWFH